MCNFLRIIFVAVFMSAASSSLFDFQRQFISRSAFFSGSQKLWVVNVITSYGRLKNYIQAWIFKILILHFVWS